MTTCVGSILFVGIIIGGAYLYLKAQRLEQENQDPGQGANAAPSQDDHTIPEWERPER